MYEVSTGAFRRLLARRGKPDRMFTEFANADGLASAKGRKNLLPLLRYSEIERPIFAQLWGATPLNMRHAASLCASLGFDGIDLNFGCPAKKSSGGRLPTCAAFIQPVHHERAVELVESAVKGAGGLPVTVKTRIGWRDPNEDLVPWLSTLNRCDIQGLTLHLRTKKEGSTVPAHWEHELLRTARTTLRPDIPLYGNGDIGSRAEGKEKAMEFGLDGVMLGRALIGNPQLLHSSGQPSLQERKEMALEHLHLHQTYDLDRSFTALRRSMKKYFVNVTDKESRLPLLVAETAGELERLIKAL